VAISHPATPWVRGNGTSRPPSKLDLRKCQRGGALDRVKSEKKGGGLLPVQGESLASRDFLRGLRKVKKTSKVDSGRVDKKKQKREPKGEKKTEGE